MAPRLSTSFCLAAALSALLAGSPLAAEARQRPMTVNEVVEHVEQRHEGRVINVEAVQTERGLVYRVRILSRDGRVRTVTVPAEGR